MNTELSNNCRSKKDYQQLHKVLKGRCEEISKDNDALSSRLINLKLLIYKAENQCRKLQDRLEYHGVDYTAAAAAASSYVEAADFVTEKAVNNQKTRPRHIRKKQSKTTDKNATTSSSANLFPAQTATASEFDTNLPTQFSLKDNLII